MCGIAGIITPNPSFIHHTLLQRMSDALAHRGPDGEGHWISPSRVCGLGHRRLAIIDLSIAAAQPMHFAQRYTIVYNGEIYNHIELRQSLIRLGYHFESNSDTEVILAAYDHYKERCLQYLDGMFAFGIWDEKEKQFFAARDRLGEKPFYYYQEDDLFIFASEMKALWAVGVPRNTEQKMLLNYLTLGYVQNPADKGQTFYQKIYSLKPAHYLRYEPQTEKFSLHSYWDIDKQTELKLSDEEVMARFEKLLNRSVLTRLRSDVPVGASLSGGLDSSTIAYSVMQAMKGNGTGNFKTFSAVFPGFEKDETAYINQVVKQFSLENYTVTPTALGLIQDFEKLCTHQEEPFPSSSIYAQYKVFELAASHGTKVMLDGQGADEILAGYNKYLHWFLQELLIRNKFSQARSEKLLFDKHKMPFKWGLSNLLAAYLPPHVSIQLEKREYNHIIHHPDISKHLLGSIRGREWDGIHKPVVTKLNDILYFNTMEFGLEELLRFSDRSSMAHGTEVRLPFLNADLVQFVFSLPTRYKISDGYTKKILRRLMNDKLPDDIVWRTEKVGYEPPQLAWMQDAQLVEYIHEAKRRLVHADLLRPQVLHKKVTPRSAHHAENSDWRYLCAAQLL